MQKKQVANENGGVGEKPLRGKCKQVALVGKMILGKYYLRTGNEGRLADEWLKCCEWRGWLECI